jgi:hypothetical protein
MIPKKILHCATFSIGPKEKEMAASIESSQEKLEGAEGGTGAPSFFQKCTNLAGVTSQQLTILIPFVSTM